MCSNFIPYDNGRKKRKGITVSQKEIKITQFADDTTIILDGTEDSLQATLNVLDIFGSISGLKINRKNANSLGWEKQRLQS